MHECSKAVFRRLSDARFATRYFVGSGIDIGAGNDSLALYRELFPLISAMRSWDVADGDAQLMAGVADDGFDFVHSSHCLEHLVDPAKALVQWLRIVKPGGHLVLTVPDEDRYEQGAFPSRYNPDHKWTFTIFKAASWSPRSINLLTLLQQFCPAAEILKLEVIDGTFRYSLPQLDQTRTPVAESAIEVVLRKRTEPELAQRGRLAAPMAAA